MPTDPSARLRIFHKTIKDRIWGQLSIIRSIKTYSKLEYQLSGLEMAASTLKDTCVYETIQLVEHAQRYPNKFKEESLTPEAFEVMVEELRRLIRQCVARIKENRMAISAKKQLDDPADPIQNHLYQIACMLSETKCTGSKSASSVVSASGLFKTNNVVAGEIVAMGVCVDSEKLSVLGVVCESLKK